MNETDTSISSIYSTSPNGVKVIIPPPPPPLGVSLVSVLASAISFSISTSPKYPLILLLVAIASVNATVAINSNSIKYWRLILILSSPKESNTPISYFLSFKVFTISNVKIITLAITLTINTILLKVDTFSNGPVTAS